MRNCLYMQYARDLARFKLDYYYFVVYILCKHKRRKNTKYNLKVCIIINDMKPLRNHFKLFRFLCPLYAVGWKKGGNFQMEVVLCM